MSTTKWIQWPEILNRVKNIILDSLETIQFKLNCYISLVSDYRLLIASMGLTWWTRKMVSQGIEVAFQLWIAYQYQLSFFESQ